MAKAKSRTIFLQQIGYTKTPIFCTFLDQRKLDLAFFNGNLFRLSVGFPDKTEHCLSYKGAVFRYFSIQK